jgi:hypothetical protein
MVDIHLLAKLGYEWMRRGTQRQVLTPGTNRKGYLGGALNFVTGKMVSVVGERKNRWSFIDLLKTIERASAAPKLSRIYVVVNNCIHTAKAVEEWIASHPRFELVWLPVYCPRANPISESSATCMTSACATTSGLISLNWWRAGVASQTQWPAALPALGELLHGGS